MAYQTGKRKRSRLGYYNAQNPDPSYYRNLPSFYINSPIGANFENALLAKEGFLRNPQMDWASFYTANRNNGPNGRAAYVLYDDVFSNRSWRFKLWSNHRLSDQWTLDIGYVHHRMISDAYAEIDDLLGAAHHVDVDPFSDTRNDLEGDLFKAEGDLFGYHYRLKARNHSAYLQSRAQGKRWSVFVAAQAANTRYQREGLFLNQAFLEDSKGKGPVLSFPTFSLKTGLRYKFNGRHWFTGRLGYLQRPPTLQNSYVNPRENAITVTESVPETITTFDVDYHIRLPTVMGRLSAYYSQFNDISDVNFFFVDSGLGSDFVQEVVTDLGKRHMGMELGLSYPVSASVKLSAAAGLGHYSYTNNPKVTINFDTAGDADELINTKGSQDLGRAELRGLRLAQGPQTAISLGVEYRDPKYWWVGMTTNYLANTYINLSTITRTESFLQDPQTGLPFENTTPENLRAFATECLTQYLFGEFHRWEVVVERREVCRCFLEREQRSGPCIQDRGL